VGSNPTLAAMDGPRFAHIQSAGTDPPKEPPQVFLFESFFGYAYDGHFGILKDHTPFLVFK
jgi:hypothetical protein